MCGTNCESTDSNDNTDNSGSNNNNDSTDTNDNTDTTDNTNDNTDTTTSSITKPVRMTIIDHLAALSPFTALAGALAVPTFSSHDYNYVAIESWTYGQGAGHISHIWANSYPYFVGSSFGSTTSEVQAHLRKLYNDNGVKVLITAFGNEVPATLGYGAVDCANKLAEFVEANHFDGVNVDWNDEHSFYFGTGEDWMIAFMNQLRSKLPDHIIVHTIKARFFQEGNPHYPQQAYIKIHQNVGNLIDFYNVEYHDSARTYADLFTSMNTQSVSYIASKGVPLNKIVVGKTPNLIFQSGFVSSSELGSMLVDAYNNLGWYAGISYYHYFYDQNGG